MDVVNAPETLSLSGSATGWDLGQALKTAGLKYDAGGDLRGTFDLTGSTKGVRAFLNTMNGTATISMSGGFIRTSLLELAGLGVVPWLFSQEMRQGYTDVVCIMAPLGISSGKVSSKSVVAETKSVQLVASGMIDWKNDRISIHAEPRPVGKPMSRSAWPFDITGRLSAPQFDLEPAGSRTRLIDRAAASPANRQPCKPDIAQAPNNSSVNDARPSILPRQLIPPANETRPNFLPRLLSPPQVTSTPKK